MHPAIAERPSTPALPDDPAARDANYSELARLMDAWMADDHAGEPEWDVEEVEPLRLRTPAVAP